MQRWGITYLEGWVSSEFLRYLGTALRMIIQFNVGELKTSIRRKTPNISQLLIPTMSGPASILSWLGIAAFPQLLLKTQLKPLILHLGVMETGSSSSSWCDPWAHSQPSCCHPLSHVIVVCGLRAYSVTHPAWGALRHSPRCSGMPADESGCCTGYLCSQHKAQSE